MCSKSSEISPGRACGNVPGEGGRLHGVRGLRAYVLAPVVSIVVSMHSSEAAKDRDYFISRCCSCHMRACSPLPPPLFAPVPPATARCTSVRRSPRHARLTPGRRRHSTEAMKCLKEAAFAVRTISSHIFFAPPPQFLTPSPSN